MQAELILKILLERGVNIPLFRMNYVVNKKSYDQYLAYMKSDNSYDYPSKDILSYEEFNVLVNIMKTH